MTPDQPASRRTAVAAEPLPSKLPILGVCPRCAGAALVRLLPLTRWCDGCQRAFYPLEEMGIPVPMDALSHESAAVM